jgi:hypothetical protein
MLVITDCSGGWASVGVRALKIHFIIPHLCFSLTLLRMVFPFVVSIRLSWILLSKLTGGQVRYSVRSDYISGSQCD